MTTRAGRPYSIQHGFLFGDVAVDAARRQLFVRGREVRCRPLPFRLLLELCAAGGAVVPRERVVQQLWGDGYVPSDESLTQVVSRLRSCLGEDGKAVRTVRGVGLRLDARVLPIARDAPTAVELPDLATVPLPAAPPPAPAPAAAPRPGRRPPGRRALLAGGLAAVGLLAVAFAVWWLGRPAPIDPGYGLEVADLGAVSRSTEDLVRRAFTAERRGDRTRALGLLEAAHRSDPATPVPAAFLVLWSYPEAEPGERARWATAAERRLTAESTPYAQLLVRYARAAADDRPAAVEAALSALLGLRPEAWRLRLARAEIRRPGPPAG